MELFFSKYFLTAICTLAICVWFVKAQKKFKRDVDENPFGDYEQPRKAATLGVLGTFFGITVGLLNFDPSPAAMQQSVTNLLSGMTTAFLTSILGMGLSIYLKDYQENVRRKISQSENFSEDATISDLINYLRTSDAEKIQRDKILVDSVEKLTASLAGNEEQLKIFRLEMRDSNEKIINEFREFANTLTENNSKALIEALDSTIKSFNENLTAQFGENFKQLNIAVGKLLDWQINYKETVETVTGNLEMTFAGIDAARNSLAQIEKSSSAISDIADDITDLIVTADFYSEKLGKVLVEINSLGNAAQAAVPKITDLVQKSCEETQNLTSQVVNKMDRLAYETSDSFNRVSKSIDSAAQKLQEESFKVTEETAKKMEDMMRTNEENLRESLETLGKAMLKISNKFATDYTPLAEKLAAIVQLPTQIERRRPKEGTIFEKA